METKINKYILFKIIVGILLIGIVVWPFFVSPKEATKFILQIINDKELINNRGVGWLVILFLFTFPICGIYLLYNSIIEAKNYVAHTCYQYQISKKKLFSLKFKQLLSPIVYIGLIELLYIFCFYNYLIIIDKILLPAALTYSLFQKFVLPCKRWDILGPVIILVNHIIIHVRLEREPWYLNSIISFVEKIAEIYNL